MNWKLTVKKWWGPVVAYLLASVLNLSQKHSDVAVILLLSICTLWTWLVILAMEWWTDVAGWKGILRAAAPLPALVLLLWGAMFFFKPDVPPNSYPWLSTNTFTIVNGQRVKEVQLHVFVREDPPNPEQKKGAAALSSLYDLTVSVSTPQMITANGAYFCSVGKQIKASEWNNSDAMTKPVGVFQLQRDINVLMMSGSSRNATWQGTILIHSNGDWEEFLTGWAKTASGSQPIHVEETHRNNVTTAGLKDTINVTPEALARYGVPFKEKFDPSAEPCPPAI